MNAESAHRTPAVTCTVDRLPGRRWRVAAIVALAVTASSRALNIQTGDYSKNDPNFVRIMTWNVLQHLGDPNEPTTPWTTTQVGSPVSAINLVVAAMNPDILLLQECGDINANLTFSQVQTAMQQWRNTNLPGYALVVSTDGGDIHNAILSRWSFTDINGDGRATTIDIPNLTAGPGGWPAGGDGGIRGWLQAEVNLPDATYLGNLYVGCSHFKAGGTSGDETDRVIAAKNIAAYIQYALNQSGDPLNIIPDASQPPQALNANTPVVWGGDFNTASGQNPVNILRDNNPADPADGTDRNFGSSWRSDVATAYNGTVATYQSGSRLDWILVQDTIASINAAWIFDTGRMPKTGNTITQGAPPNMVGLFNNATINSVASDHFPVLVDIQVPPAVFLASVSIAGPGSVNSGQSAQYTGTAHFSDSSQQDITNTGSWSVTGPGSITSGGLFTANVVPFDTSATIHLQYTSGAITENDSMVVAIPSVCDRSGDVNGDGQRNGEDIGAFVGVITGVDTDALRTCRSNMDNSAAVDAVDAAMLVTAMLI